VKPSEAELVERCRRSEPAAFEELYRHYAVRVYNLAVRLSGSQAEGEDLAQEVFVQVYRKLASFRAESSLGTWIYRLATNHCLDFLRSREGRAQQRLEPLDDDEPGPAPSAAPLRADRLDLERAIARLPLGYRTAFVLHDVEGFEHKEVASMLGIAEGTSKSQVHKARLKLREYLTAAPLGAEAPARVRSSS
jgi:RNA polymerase sigma-70 factor, ECF subfamily